MKKFNVEVDCANCAREISNELSKIKGVKNCDINFVLKEMTVEFDNGVDEIETIKELKKVGSTIDDDFKILSEKKNKTVDKRNTKLYRIIITLLIFLIISIFVKNHNENKIINFLYLMPYLIVGYDVLIKAFKGIIRGAAFDECFLMAVATFGAFALGEYTEAVFVMFFYQVGEFLQDFAIGKSEKNITDLLDIRSETANLVLADGKISVVDSKDVEVGSIVLIKNGEKVPIDGEIIEGSTLLNTSALTGESIPKKVKESDEVLSGMINTDASIKIRTTKKFDDSAASKIIEMVKNASDKKSKSENFITEFAKIYTPIVCLLAIIIFIIPTLYNALILKTDINEFNYVKTWLYRALSMLVISCPCALLVSIPLAFFSSIGRASKYGVLIKGSNLMDTLSKIRYVAFDKTGTMTKGVFEVVAVHNEFEVTEDEIIKYAAYIEYYSNHPIAKCLRKEYKYEVDITKIKDVKEISGYGLEGYVDNDFVLVGSEKLMNERNIALNKCSSVDVGTVIHLAVNSKYLGHIVISDFIKPESRNSILALKKIGIKKCIMLTGDKKEIGENVAKEIGIDEVHTELLPNDKLKIVEDIIKTQNNKNIKVAFVGDGINDAPVLVRADVGISMGSIGSDSAVEASDVVIMDDNPMKVSTAIKIAKKTMFINYFIIIFSISIKILFLILSSLGISNMPFAIFADVGVLIICILIAISLLFAKY